ncbi:MAG TPA: oxidoreductase [Burkholderiales bacterium]|nr:oxidoreductase [Burkholderiales bacterium]
MASTPENALIWFVTGCSTGFGRAIASHALKHGYRVVATARNPEQIKDIVAAYPSTGLALALDVTNADQVASAVAHAERTFGGVDVLVNNAGYGYLAAVEEGDEKEVRAMFDTNFFGLVSVTKRVLPGMRQRGRGHIINISSVGGLIGGPAAGYYNATKFAVEGLSEALSKELEPLGIRVTAIEPGPFRTDFAGRSLHQPANPIDAYAKTAGARRAEITGRSGRQAGDPERAAEAIIQVVRSPSPPLNLVLGRNGLERVREKLAKLTRTIDQWEAVTLGADFPQA